jgi:hypothetical protein
LPTVGNGKFWFLVKFFAFLFTVATLRVLVSVYSSELHECTAFKTVLKAFVHVTKVVCSARHVKAVDGMMVAVLDVTPCSLIIIIIILSSHSINTIGPAA